MRILGIKGSNNVYTCNVYLVMGDWKKLEDVNTLIDVGNDPTIIEVLKNMNTGVGKNKVEQVILTHCHSDHTAILPLIRKAFDPVVCAFSPFMSGVDRVLHDGETVHVGDREFEVIHAPGHSEDSITLYNEDEGALFVGDASLIIRSTGGTYEEGFVRTLKRLCQKKIQTMYFGHGDPLTRDADQALRTTLKMVRAGLTEKPRDTHGKQASERRT